MPGDFIHRALEVEFLEAGLAVDGPQTVQHAVRPRGRLRRTAPPIATTSGRQTA